MTRCSRIWSRRSDASRACTGPSKVDLCEDRIVPRLDELLGDVAAFVSRVNRGGA